MDSNTILGIFILIAMFILSAAVLALLGYLLKFAGFKPVSGDSSQSSNTCLTSTHKVESGLDDSYWDNYGIFQNDNNLY